MDVINAVSPRRVWRRECDEKRTHLEPEEGSVGAEPDEELLAPHGADRVATHAKLLKPSQERQTLAHGYRAHLSRYGEVCGVYG